MPYTECGPSRELCRYFPLLMSGWLDYESPRNLQFHRNKGKSQMKQFLLHDSYFLVFEKLLACTSRMLTSLKLLEGGGLQNAR